jgi:hypothetical protein
MIDGAEHSVCGCTTPSNAQILHGMQSEGAFHTVGSGDGKEIRAFYITQVERGTRIGSRIRNLHMTHLYITHMTEEEAGSWHGPEHARFRIPVLELWWPYLGEISISSTGCHYIDVGQLYILDRGTRDATKN